MRNSRWVRLLAYVTGYGKTWSRSQAPGPEQMNLRSTEPTMSADLLSRHNYSGSV
jgi:hypothetical protein